MDNVKIPQPTSLLTDYQKEQIATEYAFNAWASEAKNLGLISQKPIGLMYLPDQELTKKFQEMFREVLAGLRAAGYGKKEVK